ncbi:hypothetical protein HZU73_08063 [Apis mellifera caucasica]|uniref:Uncharacterized protein LOC100577805 isoform X1 n=1 Tax=Apis mellifera TaxID=7460 RepID=A0A7M7IGF9_APIME|nr:uncharacterized protein LOC100577805 isoform X1 [Apis mellifera]KAG6796655.1 hypothetical protein HZU73_08063 [Apis mellifera caucasica]KAG9436420.1 hypothetical protein HZU67_01377 [Apis mellifera carnica]|eukprot:XP_016768006.1 uncharacterized protein LOC100577805 isoform X1 [Apis mellifera]
MDYEKKKFRFKALLHKYVGIEKRIDQDFYSRKKILIEKLKLFCHLIENNARQHLKKDTIWDKNDKLCDIEEAKHEMIQRENLLHKENLNFKQFQRNVELELEAIKLAKKNIEENLKETLRKRTEEFSSKILDANLKNKIKVKSMEMEIEKFDLRLKSNHETNQLEINDLYKKRYKMKKLYLDEMVKYDKDIESLYTYKSTLLTEKDCINNEYAIIQDQLITQRNLYKQLKEEQELNEKKAFLERIENFRRNHAAKIIQQNWKLYYMRVSMRKKKGRK